MPRSPSDARNVPDDQAMPVQPFKSARSLTVAPFECGAHWGKIRSFFTFLGQIEIKMKA
jgi:hypothetical protein